MIYIHVPKKEIWNEEKEEFVYINEQTLAMEHSLLSISKWEEKHKKVFLSEDKKTTEEYIDYYKCMCINKVQDEVFTALSPKDYKRINDYIADPMIPFKLKEPKQKEGASKKVGDPMAAIMIYYYMAVAQIPFSCEKWHINKLLALLKIYGIKNSTPEKMSGSARHALNKQRRAALNSKG